MNNTSILDTVLGNIDTKRAKNMERRMMLAVKNSRRYQKERSIPKGICRKMSKRPSEISKWLRGDHNFTTSTLFDIEDVLNIHLIDINEYSHAACPASI